MLWACTDVSLEPLKTRSFTTWKQQQPKSTRCKKCCLQVINQTPANHFLPHIQKTKHFHCCHFMTIKFYHMLWCQHRLDVDYENFNNRFQQNRLLKDVEFPHLHTKYSLGVTFQWPQQQAALGIAHADSAVIRSDQKQPASALLSCAQAAHASWAVALEHIQLFQSLKRSKLLERREGIYIYIYLFFLNEHYGMYSNYPISLTFTS